MRKRTAWILAILLPVQILLIRLLSFFPGFVETWYSTGIYPYTSALLRISLGVLPFSLGDLLYAVLIIMLLRWIFIRLKQKFSQPRRWILEAVASLSLIYACFNLFWGLNYYRLPLHQSLGIEHEYSTEDLVRLTRHLIEKSNSLQLQITGDDSLKVEYPHSRHQLLDLAVTGYDSIAIRFPELQYQHESLKPSLFSLPLTYMGFNGYLNPLTGEGQVNTFIVPFKIPTTASHEIGHQLGFAAENEANFIACLVTMNHPNTYYRYSGYTFALSYCLTELFQRDPVLTDALLKDLHFGVQLNYLEVRAFWEAHRNPFEPVFLFTYNNFLKANNQAMGIESYNYVVALLVNYYKSFPGAL